jgi:hypothetical protein
MDYAPTIVELFKPTYQRMEQAAEEHPNLHYIADTFDKVDHQLWTSFTHVTPEGNELIAQKMLDVIKSSSLQTSK